MAERRISRARAALCAACALLLSCSSSRSGGSTTASGGATASGGTTARGGSGGTSPATSGGVPQTAGGGTPATTGGGTSGGVSADGGAEVRAGTGGMNAGASAGGSGEAGGAGAPPDSECALSARGVAIYPAWDPLGYPLYALEGCNLAYVAPDGSLHLLDLATLDDRSLDAADSNPRRPTLSADVLAWEVLIEGRSQVRVRTAAGTSTLTGEFDHAAEPKAALGAVAFTAFSAEGPNSDSDVLVYDTASGTTSIALGGPGQQRFPDISSDFVAASDFSEDPRGYFDESSSVADIVLLSRTDGVLTQRALPGKQAFPMLGEDGLLGYLHWSEVHPEPKFSAFALNIGHVDVSPESDITLREIHTDPRYVRPFVRGSVVDFIDSTGGVPRLYRAPLAPLGEPVLAIQSSSAEWLLGPTGTESWTVLGKQAAGGYALEVSAR